MKNNNLKKRDFAKERSDAALQLKQWKAFKKVYPDYEASTQFKYIPLWTVAPEMLELLKEVCREGDAQLWLQNRIKAIIDSLSESDSKKSAE
jgi:hypothetical protein